MGVTGEELPDHLGVHDGTAGGDPPQRVDELAHSAHLVFEKVADTAASIGDQLTRVLLLDVLGEDEHGQARTLAAGVDGGVDTLVAEGGR